MSCYARIKSYNQDAAYQPSHDDLLADIHGQLHKAIRDLEANCEFLASLPKEDRQRSTNQSRERGSKMKYFDRDKYFYYPLSLLF